MARRPIPINKDIKSSQDDTANYSSTYTQPKPRFSSIDTKPNMMNSGFSYGNFPQYTAFNPMSYLPQMQAQSQSQTQTQNGAPSQTQPQTQTQTQTPTPPQYPNYAYSNYPLAPSTNYSTESNTTQSQKGSTDKPNPPEANGTSGTSVTTNGTSNPVTNGTNGTTEKSATNPTPEMLKAFFSYNYSYPSMNVPQYPQNGQYNYGAGYGVNPSSWYFPNQGTNTNTQQPQPAVPSYDKQTPQPSNKTA
jgi:hypothetical protein